MTSEIPTHTHALRAVNAPGNRTSPIGNIPARTLGAAPYLAPANAVSFSSQALPPVGGGLPHNNMMPYLALTFVIALQGVFPPRS